MSQNQYKNQYKNQFKHQFKRPCDKPTLSCWSSSMQVFFQPAMVSRVSCYPFFKGQHFQSIKFPFFKGTQGYCKISLLHGYPGPEHPTCLLHWYPRPEHQTSLFQGYPGPEHHTSLIARVSEAEHQVSLSQGHPKAEVAASFFQRSKENSCKVSSNFSLVRRRCRRILYFGATLALNLLAATPGLMLKVRQEILPTKSSLEKHQVPFGFRYLLFSTKCWKEWNL